MFRSYILLRWPAVFLVQVLIALAGSCRADVTSIGSFLAFFAPPVTVYNGERLLNCTGVILSPESIALSPACVVYAHKLQEQAAVSVRNHQGEHIGQLPAIPEQPLKPAWNISFISNLKPDSAFPVLFDNYNPLFLKTATFYLLNPMAHEVTAANRSVQLHVLPSDMSEFSLSGMNPLELEQYPAGSPVINKFGQVMCLLTDGSLCINGWSGNDGSCHIDYFNCGGVTWNYCTNGEGSGQCTNEKSGEVCSVVVMPDDTDVRDDFHCRNLGGCGAIECSPDCIGNCSCSVIWGFCGLDQKTVVNPTGCIDQAGGSAPPDPRCPGTTPTTKPDHHRHSPTTLGMAIGIPLATILGVAVISAIVLVVCKYHRSGYERVP